MTREEQSANRGTIIVSASALIDLNEGTTKKGHTYLDMLDVLAREGFKVIIPERAASAAVNKLGKSPVSKLINNLTDSQPPYPNMEVVDTPGAKTNKASVIKAISMAGKSAPVFVVADGDSLLTEIGKEHPGVNVSTSRGLLSAVIKTRLSQYIPGIENKRTDEILNDKGAKGRVASVAHIDVVAGTYASFGRPASTTKRGGGPLEDELKKLTAELRKVPSLNGGGNGSKPNTPLAGLVAAGPSESHAEAISQPDSAEQSR